jgi:hypothetical protein
MSKLALRVIGLGVVIALLGVGSYAIAGGGSKNFRGAPLNGYEENPDISTVASGSFEARLSQDGSSLTYALRYSGLEGGPAAAAHVHFGKPAVNGGVSFFLCGGGGKPPCPEGTTTEAVVTGTVTAANVVGPTGQGIPAGTAGGFAEILAAMRAGHAYANVHNATFPGGEIRAQINDRRGGREDDDDDDDD